MNGFTKNPVCLIFPKNCIWEESSACYLLPASLWIFQHKRAMPLAGGEVKQLTHYSGNDEVNSWSWDSKHIYFTSSRLSRFSSYKVSIEGGTARRVFGDYFFLYDHNVVEHPVTGELFFNDTWESLNQVQLKLYKGPFNPDIQSYNVSRDGRGKISVLRLIKTAISILYQMKQMVSTIFTHSNRVIKKR